MKIEQQVTSLQISQRLKELGVPQESFFSWSTLDNELIYGGVKSEILISAFTVAELGEMLPSNISCYKTGGDNWVCNPLEGAIPDTLSEQIWGITEADARAKCLIYLLENNLITL